MDSSRYSVIVGGKGNSMQYGSDYSFIGGGLGNLIPGGEFNTICGGESNYIWDGVISLGKKGPSHYSFIGGGRLNRIEADWDEDEVDSGLDGNVIVGGKENSVWDHLNFLGGGRGNSIREDHNVLVGGLSNYLNGAFSVITAGANNYMSGQIVPLYSVIAGGRGNRLTSADCSAVGGGQNNQIVGGVSSGGIPIFHMTIPGGNNLIAQSYAQTVIGAYNVSQGNSDSTNFTSSNSDDRLFIIGNGNTDDTHRSNAFEVSNGGHSIVFHNNGKNPSAGSVSSTPAYPAIRGARYIDNTPIAWGQVSATGNIISEFGVSGSIRKGLGWYQIVLNYTDPHFPAVQIPINHGSAITATITGGTNANSFNCEFINASPIAYAAGQNTFDIHISHNTIVTGQLVCSTVDDDFMFVVMGRP